MVDFPGAKADLDFSRESQTEEETKIEVYAEYGNIEQCSGDIDLVCKHKNFAYNIYLVCKNLKCFVLLWFDEVLYYLASPDCRIMLPQALNGSSAWV